MALRKDIELVNALSIRTNLNSADASGSIIDRITALRKAGLLPAEIVLRLNPPTRSNRCAVCKQPPTDIEL